MNSSSTVSSRALATESYYPWLVITFSALFLIYKYILQVSPSVMTNQLMAAFHVQGAGLGNLTATYFYTYLVVQLFAGPLFDKYSLRTLTALSIAISAVGSISFAYSHTLLHAELSRALVGVGVAFATVSYMKATALWFKPNQFAFVGGLLATAAMMGALFGETPLALLVSHAGWQNSLAYCGMGGLFLAALFFLCVRDKKQERESVKTNFSSIFIDFFHLLKNKNNWLLTFYSGLAFSPVAVFGGLWGNPFLETAYNINTTKATSLTSMVFLGLAIGGPLLGFLSDRLNKRFPVMVAGLLMSFFSVSVVLYAPLLSMYWLGFFLFFFGFGTGSFMLGFAMGKELNKLALTASVIALINTGDAIFGAFTEPLAGKLLDLFWNGKLLNGIHYFAVQDYRLALSLLPLYLLTALAFLILLKKGGATT